jgi:hypothetical protein
MAEVGSRDRHGRPIIQRSLPRSDFGYSVVDRHDWFWWRRAAALRRTGQPWLSLLSGSNLNSCRPLPGNPDTSQPLDLLSEVVEARMHFAKPLARPSGLAARLLAGGIAPARFFGVVESSFAARLFAGNLPRSFEAVCLLGFAQRVTSARVFGIA